ncbi:MAG: SPFH domain-containing protein [Pseudomonadota bacterium]
MRFVVVGIVVLALGLLSIWTAAFRVEPGSVAVVTQNGRIVRIANSGLQWHVPLVEEIGFIPIAWQYKRSVVLDTRLSDGSPCRIAADILFHTPDPRRTFSWRVKNGLDVSARSAQDDGADYTEAAQSFRVAAISAVKATSADAARSGALSDWMRGYRSPIHIDGSQVQAVQPTRVDCEAEALSAQPQPKAMPLEFGAFRPFVRSLERPATGDETVFDFELEQQQMWASNGQHMQLHPLPVRYVISHQKRFTDTFGPGKRGRETAVLRIRQFLTFQLRNAIGALDPDALKSFDPLSTTLPGTKTAKRLDRLGIRIVEIGGDKAGYKIQEKRK